MAILYRVVGIIYCVWQIRVCQRKVVMKRRITCLISMLGAGMVMLAAQAGEPLLRINTQMHTSVIRCLALDPTGKTLLTCSYDKTARLWDADKGDLLRILRPPVGKANEGMLYCGVFTPDGKTAIVGGNTVDYYFYIFDTQNGTLLRKVGPLPGIAVKMSLSKDGKFLAVGIGRSRYSSVMHGARIYKTADWSEVAVLDDCVGSASGMDFLADGSLALALSNCQIKVYDSNWQLLVERKLDCDYPSESLSFSPDGRLLAVAVKRLGKISVLDPLTLKTLYEPVLDSADLQHGEFSSIAFSRDGTKLYAAGSKYVFSQDERVKVVCVWQDSGRGALKAVPVSEFAVMDILPTEDGGLFFCTTHPEWGKLSPQYSQVITKVCESNNFIVNNESNLRVGDDSDQIGFANQDHESLVFSVRNRSLDRIKSSSPAYLDSLPGFLVTDYYYSGLKPKLNGKELEIDTVSDVSYCVDIFPDTLGVLVGATWNLYSFDLYGNLIWKTHTNAQNLTVNISGDGKTAVVEQNDGTIRWYRMSDGQLLLSLFLHKDNQRWILWTPLGYYDCAPHSEDIVGWAVNNGLEKESVFYPLGRFRSTFYRPDVIDLILSSLDERSALEKANAISGIENDELVINEMLPPVLKIISPTDGQNFAKTAQHLEFGCTWFNSEPLTRVKVLVDGHPWQTLLDPVLSNGYGSIDLDLPGRDVILGISVENKWGSSNLQQVRMVWNGGNSKPHMTHRANLYALVIGISAYRSEAYKLKYCAKDARDFSSVLRSQEGLFYDHVEVRLLTDEQATRDAILDGMDWLQTKCTAEDVAMIFLSGHGVNDNIGLFYYLPVAANVARLKATAIPFSDFENTLGAIPGKVVVFADACHSGGIWTDANVASPDMTRFLNDLSEADIGAVIFTSCTPKQQSYENDKWKNGAFTKALIEGMNGAADYMKTGSISIKELDLYVSGRVSELTGTNQTPTTIVPRSIADFEIGMIP
jgi:WD40 repeat protein